MPLKNTLTTDAVAQELKERRKADDKLMTGDAYEIRNAAVSYIKALERGYQLRMKKLLTNDVWTKSFDGKIWAYNALEKRAQSILKEKTALWSVEVIMDTKSLLKKLATDIVTANRQVVSAYNKKEQQKISSKPSNTNTSTPWIKKTKPSLEQRETQNSGWPTYAKAFAAVENHGKLSMDEHKRSSAFGPYGWMASRGNNLEDLFNGGGVFAKYKMKWKRKIYSYDKFIQELKRNASFAKDAARVYEKALLHKYKDPIKMAVFNFGWYKGIQEYEKGNLNHVPWWAASGNKTLGQYIEEFKKALG